MLLAFFLFAITRVNRLLCFQPHYFFSPLSDLVSRGKGKFFYEFLSGILPC